MDCNDPTTGAKSPWVNELKAACASGDLNRVHELYSAWFAKQKPDPATGFVRHRYLHLAAAEAALNGHWPCLNYLLELGVSLGLVIGYGVDSKSIQVLEGMLDKGWNINSPSGYYFPPYLGYCLSRVRCIMRANLQARSVVKDEALVRWFLEHGADPNIPARVLDNTPLSSAASYAPLHIVKLLFEHGGSADKGNLVCHAADRKDPEAIPVLQYLVDRGAPTNEWYHETRPDLHCWVMACGGRSPLYLAAEAGCIENVKFLLEHGADPNKRCAPFPTLKRDGPLPIEGAISGKREGIVGKHDEIIQLLTEASKPSAPLPKNTGFWSLLGWK
ncbi:MAG: hypothetical protein LQ348_002226 [Seirophora lacunosa]|nr:MAG: hypothetical protein LQ348_002226 [Seirophora lacunosa]